MAENLTPVKAIRAYCLYCMCGQANEIKLCPSKDCSLYPYRLGKNPNRKPHYTEEQKEKYRIGLLKAREKHNTASD